MRGGAEGWCRRLLETAPINGHGRAPGRQWVSLSISLLAGCSSEGAIFDTRPRKTKARETLDAPVNLRKRTHSCRVGAPQTFDLLKALGRMRTCASNQLCLGSPPCALGIRQSGSRETRPCIEARCAPSVCNRYCSAMNSTHWRAISVLQIACVARGKPRRPQYSSPLVPTFTVYTTSSRPDSLAAKDAPSGVSSN